MAGIFGSMGGAPAALPGAMGERLAHRGGRCHIEQPAANVSLGCVSHEPELPNYSAPPFSLVADADQRLAFWRTLQELAGVVTPFTKKARQAAERDVAATHEAEIARLKQEYEARIAALKGEFQAEATERVTERLMALAGRRADGGPNGEDDA